MKNIIISMLCMLSAWAQVAAQAPTPANTRLEIYQIKVTEGHATLVVTKSSDADPTIYRSVLIDAGKSSADANAIEKVIKNVAKGRLDAVFVTHHDQDHWGGLTGNLGLLRKRCRPFGSLHDANMLELYLNHEVSGEKNDNNPKGKNWSISKINTYAGDNVNIINWTNDLPDIPLVPASASKASFIQLKTLAVNGYLEGETTTAQRLMLGKSPDEVKSKSEKVAFFKNNASAVAMITWDDFSFLVQGDLEAAFAGKEYKFNDRNVAVNTQGNSFEIKQTAGIGIGISVADVSGIKPWNLTKARTNEFYKGETEINSSSYIIRMNNIIRSTDDTPKKRLKTGVEAFHDQHWVAAPSEWYHKLGQKINSANGAGGYAHACVALVPHHGALTSNLWFDADHAIIGSNRTNLYGHPRKDAIIALYNSAKPKYTYITYLLDKGGQKMNTDVYDTFNKGHFPTDNTFNLYYLDGKGSSSASTTRDEKNGTAPYFKGPVGTQDGLDHKVSYFKFTVKPATTGSRKQIRVETDNKSYSGTKPLLNWAECSRTGH